MPGGLTIQAGSGTGTKDAKKLLADDPQVQAFLAQSGLDADLLDEIERGSAEVLSQMNEQIDFASGAQAIAGNVQVQKQTARKRKQDAAASTAIAISARKNAESGAQAPTPRQQSPNLFKL